MHDRGDPQGVVDLLAGHAFAPDFPLMSGEAGAAAVDRADGEAPQLEVRGVDPSMDPDHLHPKAGGEVVVAGDPCVGQEVCLER